MRLYLDTFHAQAGDVDESVCLWCNDVGATLVKERGAAVQCLGCGNWSPPPMPQRCTYGHAALLWYPDVDRPIRAFGYVRTYFAEGGIPTAVFMRMGGLAVFLPLLALVWDISTGHLIYTPRGWQMTKLPAEVRKYLRQHPTYGVPDAEEVRYLTVEQPAYPIVDVGASA